MTKTNKVLRAQRKEARRKALEAIAGLSDDDLRNLHHEIGREYNQQANVLNEVRVRMEAIRDERERRRSVTSAGICVSDHAVLRYLERVKGFDMESIRKEIITVAQRAGKFDSGNKYARRRDGADGVTLGLDEIRGMVTTVLTRTENDVMSIPALSSPEEGK